MKINSIPAYNLNSNNRIPNFKAITVDDEIWTNACPIHKGSKPAKDFKRQMAQLEKAHPDIDCHVGLQRRDEYAKKVVVSIKYTKNAQDGVKNYILDKLNIKPGFFKRMSENSNIDKTAKSREVLDFPYLFDNVKTNREGVVNRAFGDGIESLIIAYKVRVPHLQPAQDNGDTFRKLKAAKRLSKDVLQQVSTGIYQKAEEEVYSVMHEAIKKAPQERKLNILDKHSETMRNYFQEHISDDELQEYVIWADKKDAAMLLKNYNGNEARFKKAISKVSPEEQKLWRDAILEAEIAMRKTSIPYPYGVST